MDSTEALICRWSKDVWLLLLLFDVCPETVVYYNFRLVVMYFLSLYHIV